MSLSQSIFLIIVLDNQTYYLQMRFYLFKMHAKTKWFFILFD